ncbi:MAG TPA: phosphotransferase [Candidatus Brocadiia bacterium]|nr:phosphotransferase [Candidatus Brocadiia bacterium]
MPNLVQPEIDETLLRNDLPAQYDALDKSFGIRDGGGTGNRSFILKSGGSEWFLRVRNPKYDDKPAMDFELDLLLRLKAGGLPVHPPILSRDGHPWGYAGDFTVQLFPFIRGTMFEDGNPEQIKEAARILREWHKLAMPLCGDLRKPWEREDSFMIAFAGRDLALQGATDQSQMSELLRTTDAIHQLLRRLPPKTFWSLPQTIVHADYHPANMLFDGSRMVGLFDFDYSCEHPRLKDLANALIYFGAGRERQLDSSDIRTYIQKFAFIPERIRCFMSEYEREAPLTKAERENLSVMMLGRWLQMRSCGIVKLPAGERAAIFCDGMGDVIEMILSFRLP